VADTNLSYLSGQVTIGTTPTLITATSSGQSGVLIQNSSGAAVFLGGPNVTTANGYQLAISTSITVPTVGGKPHDLWGVVASTGSVVSFLLPN
jgi:hypothetical protein